MDAVAAALDRRAVSSPDLIAKVNFGPYRLRPAKSPALPPLPPPLPLPHPPRTSAPSAFPPGPRPAVVRRRRRSAAAAHRCRPIRRAALAAPVRLRPGRAAAAGAAVHRTRRTIGWPMRHCRTLPRRAAAGLQLVVKPAGRRRVKRLIDSGAPQRFLCRAGGAAAAAPAVVLALRAEVLCGAAPARAGLRSQLLDGGAFAVCAAGGRLACSRRAQQPRLGGDGRRGAGCGLDTIPGCARPPGVRGMPRIPLFGCCA